MGSPRALAALAAATVIASVASCGDDGDVEVVVPEAQVVARVGDRTIDSDLFILTARARTGPGEFPRTGSGFEVFAERLTRQLVVDEILVAEAALRGLGVAQADLDRTVSLAGEGVEGPDRLPEVVVERYGSEEAYRAVVHRRMLVEQAEGAVRAELAVGIEPTPEQVEAARIEHADRLVQPARLRARQVFAEEAEQIRAAQAELADGVPFADLAQQYSGSDGDMGWMSLAEAPPELVDATDGLAVGEFTEVVRSPLGYHLFQVLGREEAQTLSAEQADELLGRLVVDVAVETAYREWLAERLGAPGVSIDEDALARVRCCRQGLPYVELEDS